MKNIILSTLLALAPATAMLAENVKVLSPNGKLLVEIKDDGGKATYSVSYGGKVFLEPSRLGLVANAGDFSQGLKITGSEVSKTDETYEMTRTKASSSHYVANGVKVAMQNAQNQTMNVEFRVSDNDIAFRYSFPVLGGWQSIRVDREVTAFNLPAEATAFITPLSEAGGGWCRANPAYEEKYLLDAPLNTKSLHGEGFAFPALFHIGTGGWLQVSETGTSSDYAACSLSEYKGGEGYTVKFPSVSQASGIGSATSAFGLPGSTPWRTITLGESLKPIVETTIAYDVVKPLFESSRQYKPGRYVWSWILGQDPSINMDDQIKFVDMAHEMGYEYSLIDANWEKDAKIGRKRMAELCKYAKSKGVEILLWYSSNGCFNDTREGPMHLMDKGYIRRREMKWLKEIGVAGIKVDYFGSDKQMTMKYYEDILADANDFGLFVIFHGCTLPRGWERMYPNFVSSEAVRASENVYFNEESAKSEAVELSTFAFTRNAVASMDYGGTLMNRNISYDNKSRHRRHTSDVLEIAASVFTQTSVQCIGIMPNNLKELPQFELDLLKQIPTAWDETHFIDGYPGKYFIVARRSGDKWYVAGLNATEKEMKLTLDLPMLTGKKLTYYNDAPVKKGELFPEPQMSTLKVDKDGKAKVTIQPNGGLMLTE